jgi:hypothetical protein
MWRWIGLIRFKLDNPQHVWALLGACWALHAAYIPYEMTSIIRQEDSSPFAGPPFGHPERLAGDQSPTPVERELWTALALPSRRNLAAEPRLTGKRRHDP